MIVADAGPLIIFGKTCGVKLIKAVVEEILVPPAVVTECTADMRMPGAMAIREALDTRLLTLLDSVDAAELSKDLLLLDNGEKEAIAAAHARHCGVLLDETVGRAVARKLGVPTIGSLGLLLKAKEMGLIAKIGPVIEQWRAANYFLSKDLVAAALERAGEHKRSADKKS